jgi:hypothetical protein
LFAVSGTAPRAFAVAAFRAVAIAAGTLAIGSLRPLATSGSFTPFPGRAVAALGTFAPVAIAAFLRHCVTCHHAEACGSHH